MAERYATIVADPPWPIAWNVRSGVGLPYQTMAVADIAALDVTSLACDDAHLYLWATPEMHRRGLAVDVAEAWGFAVVGELIWSKGMSLGHFPRPSHEPCLVCRRGSLPFNAGDVPSVQTWKMVYEQRPGKQAAGRKHSAKPDGFIDLVERVSPGPYLEMFARRQRLGWDTWGNEALGHVELAPAPIGAPTVS